MNLVWKEQKGASPFEAAAGDVTQYVIYLSEFDGVEDFSVKPIIEECIDKSISYFPSNINDESLFFLCEWDCVYSILTIVVTDDKKENDSPHIIKCCFNGIDKQFKNIRNSTEDRWQEAANSYSSKVKGWIKDYLTTCSGFMDYSLVAAFHSEERSASELL